MTASRGAVVLLSGGVDSTVLLYHVSRQLERRPLHALSFHYGQRHARELDCAAWHAAHVGVDAHRQLDLAFLGDVVKGGTALVHGGADVPDLDTLSDADRQQPPTYVPNRNMMLLSVAAAYAEAHGIEDVFYGAQAQDEYGYWDCTATFLEHINAVLALNRRRPVSIHAPFVARSKADNVRLGLELGVDFGRTWSCYRGGDAACGRCPTCVERVKAFAAVNVNDPLPYAAR